jgi:hypothetical protein
MNFTLYYQGLLKTNGNPKEKHNLRKQFHPQLKTLWSQEPLLHFAGLYENSNIKEPNVDAYYEFSPDDTIARQVGPFTFVPLICRGLHLVARVHVTLLRREPPGSIVTQGGDIDNRLKTLLDSLKIPEPNALPKEAIPDHGETPFFCLLEDDNLITEISVNTKQLLEPSGEKGDVIIVLDIETIKTGTLLGGLELP